MLSSMCSAWGAESASKTSWTFHVVFLCLYDPSQMSDPPLAIAKRFAWLAKALGGRAVAPTLCLALCVRGAFIENPLLWGILEAAQMAPSTIGVVCCGGFFCTRLFSHVPANVAFCGSHWPGALLGLRLITTRSGSVLATGPRAGARRGLALGAGVVLGDLPGPGT